MAGNDAQDNGLLARWILLLHATRDPRLSKAAVAVLASVLDRMKAGIAWPSLGRIATDARTGRRNVIRVVDQLVSLGYLERESGDRTKSNRYRMGSVSPGPSDAADPTKGRDVTDTKVGTQPSPEVGTQPSPEPAYKNLPSEPTQERAPKVRTRKAKPDLTFAQWIEAVGHDDEKAIPSGDPIFTFAEEAGIPIDFLYLAWRWFGNRYRDDPKTYRDWRTIFRRAVQEDWHRCWRHDNATNQLVLTNVGLQLQKQLDAQERDAA